MNPLTVFDALATQNVKPGDIPGFRSLLDKAVPEVKRLQAGYQEACETYATLAQDKRVHEAKLRDATQKEHEQFAAVMREAESNTAFDLTSAYQGVLSRGLEREARQHVLDFINHVRLPAAFDRKLEANRDLRRAEHLEASLYAALSHATMLEKLEQAGVYQTHGRVIAVSETTSRLEQIATEAHRQAGLADAELTASRAAQLTRTQQRQAGALITKAEAVFTALELSRSTNSTESSTR
jgi:hypothetical protein